MLEINSTPYFALRAFRQVALSHPTSFGTRYGWPDRTETDVDAVCAEVVAKIPASATKVLEIGCGGGKLAQALRTARPTLGYRGIDLVPENVASAKALLPAEDFQIGNAWEYLSEATVDWDFVVSVLCLFSHTGHKWQNLLFDLHDAKAPRGFVVVTSHRHIKQAVIDAKMPQVLTTSVNATASYHAGARDFLTGSHADGLHPIYVHRAGTTAPAPTDPLPDALRLIAGGLFNSAMAVTDARQAGSSPPSIVGIVASGGLVTGTTTLPIDPSWQTRIESMLSHRA
jgi:SAM-dependent methyltransferase